MAKPPGQRKFGRVEVVRGGIAVGAIRLSSLTDNTSSPERQREIITGEAGLVGVPPESIRWAEDLDLSATKLAPWERPELSYWLNHPDEYQHLIFWKFDRVCRNVLDAAWLIQWALENQVNIICHSPRLDLSSALGRGIALFIASIAEMEAENTQERIMDARAYMARVARWPAGKPRYGFKLAPHPSGKGHMLEHHPDHGPVVRRIVDEFLSEEPFSSYETIAAGLSTDGIAPPATTAKSEKRHEKSTWYATGVQKMFTEGLDSLRNLVMVRGEPQRDESGELLRYGPPLVDDDEAERIRAEVERRKNSGNGATRRKNSSLLLDVAACALCSGNLYFGGAVVKRTYSCNTRGCKTASMLASYIEPYAEREFLKRVGSMEYIYAITTAGKSHDAEMAELKEAMTELETDRYERRLYKGAEGARRFADRYGRLESRLAIVEGLPRIEGTSELVHSGMTYATRWEVSTTSEKRQMFMDAGVKVRVSPKEAGKRQGEFEYRLKFSMTGNAGLHSQGHDDADAAENFA